MIEIIEKNKCSGCSACMNVCPVNCITMQYDEEGFLYPEVNKELCIDCGLCEKMCQSQNPIKSDNEPKAYACFNKDENIRMNSSSGGVFTLIAESIINKGGVVFGAAFDDEFNVNHICVKNTGELSKLRGSKYVQSAIGNTYKEAEKYLETDVPVLFTGTPCQIDGLLHYLKKDYEKLYTQDIVCHGVPSAKAWEKYLSCRKKEQKSEISRIFFRNKRNGWENYSVAIDFKDGTEYNRIYKDDSFMKGFVFNLYLRPSCYECYSKTLNRNSDITLADFWGVKDIEPDMFDDNGTSLVFVNSEKGQCLINSVAEKLRLKETDINKAVKKNSAAYLSTWKTKKRDKFFKLIYYKDFDKVIRICTKKTVYTELLKVIKRVYKKVLKER